MTIGLMPEIIIIVCFEFPICDCFFSIYSNSRSHIKFMRKPGNYSRNLTLIGYFPLFNCFRSEKYLINPTKEFIYYCNN